MKHRAAAFAGTLIFLFFMFFLTGPMVLAQSADTRNVGQKVKLYLGDVVRQVETAGTAEEKTVLLNESFDRLDAVLTGLESRSGLTEQDLIAADLLKRQIQAMQDELNGKNGFEPVAAEELDEFANYSLQYLEQALDRTISISLGMAILIGLLLILI